MIAYFFVTMVIYLLITLWEFKKFVRSSLQSITGQPIEILILLVSLTIMAFYIYIIYLLSKLTLERFGKIFILKKLKAFVLEI